MEDTSSGRTQAADRSTTMKPKTRERDRAAEPAAKLLFRLESIAVRSRESNFCSIQLMDFYSIIVFSSSDLREDVW